MYIVSVLLAQYCAGDKIEKNEMGWACGAYGRGEGGVQGLAGETGGKEIIRSGITFVSRNLRQPKRDFPQVSIENRLIRSGCCPLFKDKFYKIVKSTL